MSILLIPIFALIPAIGMFLGSMAGGYVRLKPTTLSLLQHFTSGLVFAAVAIELLPKILGQDSVWTIALGFIFGALLMLFLKWFTSRSSALALKYAVGIDLFIDGILIGVAFLAGTTSGFIITIAFSIEMINLGLSTTNSIVPEDATTSKRMVQSILLSVCLPIGAILSAVFLSILPESIYIETLSFGVAALLYLVTEELLLEAHQTKEAPWTTSLFFLGFLCVLVFRI